MTFLFTVLLDEEKLAVYAHYDRKEDLVIGLLKISVFSWEKIDPLLTSNVFIHEVCQ